MKITFLGAAAEVTGSCYLVETGLARACATARQAFVVHGEADTAQIFCDTMRAQLGWNATVPAAHSMVTL